MANNKPQTLQPSVPPINDNVFNLKRVHFIKDIPIFLNFVNKVEGQFYDLVIKTSPHTNITFLYITDKKTKQVCLVPLSSVASADLS